jgi:hypothetical protein
VSGRVNVDDTSCCPAVPQCEVCGRVTEVVVATADTQVGVLCVTLCPVCAEFTLIPRMPTSVAAVRVGAHCVHLGITVDEMAAALDRGRER